VNRYVFIFPPDRRLSPLTLVLEALFHSVPVNSPSRAHSPSVEYAFHMPHFNPSTSCAHNIMSSLLSSPFFPPCVTYSPLSFRFSLYKGSMANDTNPGVGFFPASSFPRSPLLRTYPLSHPTLFHFSSQDLSRPPHET